MKNMKIDLVSKMQNTLNVRMENKTACFKNAHDELKLKIEHNIS